MTDKDKSQYAADTPVEAASVPELLYDTMEASARLTNASLLVYDFEKKRIIHHTEKLIFLDEPLPEELLGENVNPYWVLAGSEEQRRFVDAMAAYLRLLDSFSEEQKLHHVFSFDFYIMHENRRLQLVQKFTPLKFRPDGSLWLGLLSIFPATGQPERHAIVFGNRFRYTYIPEKRQFAKIDVPLNLTDAEKQVLLMTMKGYSVEQTADSLCRSVNTIKTHRRHLLDKLHIASLSEAYFLLSDYYYHDW